MPDVIEPAARHIHMVSQKIEAPEPKEDAAESAEDPQPEPSQTSTEESDPPAEN